MSHEDEIGKPPLLISRGELEDEIAGVMPGCRLEFDANELRCKAPVGTTHFGWDEIEGDFVARGDGSVTFDIKPQCRKRHNWFIRAGFKATRRQFSADVRLAPEKYGPGERLADALNRQLAARRPSTTNTE